MSETETETVTPVIETATFWSVARIDSAGLTLVAQNVPIVVTGEPDFRIGREAIRLAIENPGEFVGMIPGDYIAVMHTPTRKDWPQGWSEYTTTYTYRTDVRYDIG